jgi:uncharacterized membrane protein YfcA
MGFDNSSLILIGLIFVWTGFVRTGLGFGGAALGLPLMLLVGGSPKPSPVRTKPVHTKISPINIRLELSKPIV